MRLEVGVQIERWEIESVLGSGGLAVVYGVRHTTLGTPRALKVVQVDEPIVAERLIREGRVQAELVHPNIVQVLDVLIIDEQPALLMERVDGPTLDRFVADERPSIAERERLFRGVVAAVAHAHAHGVVHRDLKPANVLIADPAGAPLPRVTDFGIAKTLRTDAVATRQGAVLGTPAYMAPEQLASAGTVDARADLYSLGAILYELLCGERPFSGDDVWALADSARRGAYAPIAASCPDAPAHLVAAVGACLAADPNDRIPTCAALLRVLDGHPVERPVRDVVETWSEVAYPDTGPDALASPVASTPEVDAEAPRALPAPVVPATMTVRRPSPLAPYLDRWRAIPRGWRMLIGTGGGFGGVTFVVTASALLLAGMAVAPALYSALLGAIAAGLFYGLTMTLSLGAAHVAGITRGGERSLERMSPEQQLTLHLAAPPDRIGPVAAGALTSLRLGAELDVDADGTRYSARTAIGIRSFGEHVSITLEADAAGTAVRIESRPVVPTTLVDYGKGRENVQHVADVLLDAFPLTVEIPEAG